MARVAGGKLVQAREVRLPEFSKLIPKFNGRSFNPVDAENLVRGVEKAFLAFKVANRMKMPLAEFQLKESANDWYKNEKANLQEPVNWDEFKALFYKKLFPQITRDKMLG